MANIPITRALISVSDKTGIIEFARFLADHRVEILSTGGTATTLRDAGIPVIDVSDHTGFPEMLDGRVKTLHPKIHGGLLGVRDDAAHQAAMEEHSIAPIDLVVVNLYPFEATVAKGADFDTCIENIDIGGPSMVRSAAKNHKFVTIVTDHDDYAKVMAGGGSTTLELRKELAAKAYARTAAYDAAISRWFAGQQNEVFPDTLAIGVKRRQVLRYGENPHQQAAFYVSDTPPYGIATAEQLQGKELSYNNLNDTDAAFELVSEFDAPTVAIIKHANPCGIASAKTLKEAYVRALACDSTSAFGGIIAVNRTLDAAAAEDIAKLFVEVIIAPDVDKEAQEIIAKKKNLRLLVTGGMPDRLREDLMVKSLAGGLLLQGRDNGRVTEADFKVVTKVQPTPEQLRDLLFAFTVCKHVKSNAIVLVKDGATVGIGAGQMSRVDSTRIATWKAGDKAKGSVLASDAFFPFADNVESAKEAGVAALIQPGGSVRDDEVIAAADEAGMPMVFTGMRHFRH